MKKSKIFYFGNKYIEKDSLAIKIAEKLKLQFKNFDFIYISNIFELIDVNLDSSILLDVAKGIKKPVLLNEDKIKPSNLSTTHDFDLGFFLKLTGKKADVVAIPENYDESLALNEVKSILLNFHPILHSKNE